MESSLQRSGTERTFEAEGSKAEKSSEAPEVKRNVNKKKDSRTGKLTGKS